MNIRFTITNSTFVASLIGIFLLLLITFVAPIQSYTIDELSLEQLNKKVSVVGVITQVRVVSDSSGFSIITIQDSTNKQDSIDVTTHRKTTFSEGDSVIVHGRVTQYNQKLQIDAHSIYIRT